MARQIKCYVVLVLLLLVNHFEITLALRKSACGTDNNYNPVADPKAVIVSGNARFSVLTSWVIRLEWTTSGRFEDRASLGIVNRRLAVPNFTSQFQNGALTITTDKLTLVYKPNGNSFSADNLVVFVNGVDGVAATWTPGTANTGNLLGTIRTLDTVNGAIELDCGKQTNTGLHCTYGVISRSGWALVDESARPLFDSDPVWPWFTTRANTSLVIDWYFFGHGLNFEQAMLDFTAIAGKLPLPPRFAFGTWWSRYWAYSDIELIDLVSQFETHKVPLDVLVIDMDWHLTFYKEARAGQRDQAGQEVGWSGYTWDPQLFPNPTRFLDWVQSRGLKSTLNLHPASGVQPHELRYPQMATASGINPATQKYVPFDLTNKSYARNLYNIMLHPLEEQGIDFWWLDWQQGENWFNIPELNPTFWLNYCFFTNPDQWQGSKRPLLFHRWGGLGNHRYQIGFTGDVVPSWASLNFQPYFTATAANVGYGYWSHDIGGHTTPTPSELYTRWVQWGAFAPVLRTHTTKNAESERRIWAYPLTNFLIMRNAFVLRASLLPYTYTAARIAYDTGLSLIRGLYYSWPTYAEAYQFPGQYLFGDDLIVSPVTSPGDSVTGLTQWRVWIPPGEWIEWFSGLSFTGPIVVTRLFALDDIPVYVRSGGIVPFESPGDRAVLIGGSKDLPTTLTFVIFASKSISHGETNVYEDDGNTDAYKANSSEYSWTTANYSLSNNNKQMDVVIYPVTGPMMPKTRSYRITINGVPNPSQVRVDGVTTPNWTYVGDNLALEIVAGDVSTAKGVHVSVTFMNTLDDARLLSGLPLAFKRMAAVKTLLDNQWEAVFQEDYKSVILAASAGQRMVYNPETVGQELNQFADLYTAGTAQVRALKGLKSDVQAQAVALLTSAQPRTR